MNIIEQLILTALVVAAILLSKFVGCWFGVNPWIVALPFAFGIVIFFIKPAFKKGRFTLGDCPFLGVLAGLVTLIAYSAKLIGFYSGAGTLPIAISLGVLAFLSLLIVGSYRTHREKKK